ncbi:hypothetical protein P5673_011010 [Acropora cervicornis]|uniref:Uncharacterized protein n=1 Tax=Acropora cervicornis TaxID=6130 RepID=A0AAD9V8E1_ACRCE|nr:hypothetical protein P5673_011010 [Acropora cervicornis]
MYSVTCSKLALTVCDKLHPADNECTASSLWRRSYSIDNDQVFLKKWTVRKDSRAQISVLTSVCVTPIHPNRTLQWNSDLALGAWDSCVDLARTSEEERARLWDLCCASEADKEVIHREGRSWGADYNCPSHHTAEVSQEQAGWLRSLYPSFAENYRASAAHGIRTRATSSNLTRVLK